MFENVQNCPEKRAKIFQSEAGKGRLNFLKSFTFTNK